MALILYALIFSALKCLLVRGQTTHTVVVGLKGSFFDPPTTSAGLGDTVTFIFAGFVHTVTQSSLASPCLPLPGGFSSGPAGKMDNGSEPAQTWDLHITNVSQPIWFFCEVGIPLSHCGSGMVGAINPPSIEAYTNWRLSALGVSNTPVPAFTPALTGIGAFATQTPVIPPTPVSIPPPSVTSSTSDSALTSQTTATAVPSAVPASSSGSSPSHLGAIVGGAVGGGVLIVLLIAVLLWYNRQQRFKEIPPSPSTDDSNFFRYNPQPVRRPSEAFMEAKQLENSSSAAFSQITPPRTISPDTPLSPNRRGGVTPALPPGVPRVIIQPQTPAQQMERTGFDRQTSYGSLTTTSAGGSDHVNIQALASEVAVLLRNPSASTGQSSLLNPEGPRTLNKNLESRHGEPVNRTESPMGPPAYRAVGGMPDRAGGNR